MNVHETEYTYQLQQLRAKYKQVSLYLLSMCIEMSKHRGGKRYKTY